MALWGKLKKLFGVKEKQQEKKGMSDKDLEFYKGLIAHHQAIEDVNRDKYAIEAMKRYLKDGSTAMQKYYYAMPHTRDGKQGFAMLNFEHTFTAELYRDGGEVEQKSPTYGRFVTIAEDHFEVERLDEAQTMKVKQEIDLAQEQTPEC